MNVNLPLNALLISSYSDECTQVQIDDSKSVINQLFLHILNHQQKILLQSSVELIPTHIIAKIRDVQITVSGHLSKVTVQKKRR